ncbi:MAG TPA: malonate decarboxylase holo-ACP synthase [Steroidobacteraceae bacterium]|nr:malonate decarboxylase holo-ACP synthase [Steroidobacteraceae bacterium]
MPPEIETHALLRLADARALEAEGGLPAWAAAALRRAPWVVVRRARRAGGLIPVGVRGASRGERLAAWLHPHAVLEYLTPCELAARAGWRGSARCAHVPALAALETVAGLMRSQELLWGPCGSVGFELASGSTTATEDSDLDLMVAVEAPLPRAAAAALQARLARLPVRAEVLLEGPQGAVALAEYASGRAPLLLRTVDGPRLVEDPWGGAAAAA